MLFFKDYTERNRLELTQSKREHGLLLERHSCSYPTKIFPRSLRELPILSSLAPKKFEILLHFILLCTWMKSRSFILRCAAFVLILVFSQKTGAGLLFHNLLHTNQSAGNSDKKNSNADISYACSCVDDFLMPFVGEEETVLCFAPVTYPETPVYLQASLSFTAISFASLRGPPAIL